MNWNCYHERTAVHNILNCKKKFTNKKRPLRARTFTKSGLFSDHHFEKMMLHVKVVQIKNLPKVDTTGHCDAYCSLKLGEQSLKSRMIENSANPLIRQDFHFKVENFTTDKLFIMVYDHDTLSRDDKLCDFEIFVKDLQAGAVTDKWYNMRPIVKSNAEIRLMLHFSRQSDQPFVASPFDVYVANVRVIEYRSTIKSDYRCVVQMSDQTPRRTEKLKDTAHPIFEEEFSMLISDFATDKIKLSGYSSKGLVGTAEVPVTKYEVGKVVREWFDIGEDKMRAAFHIAPYTVAPFAGEEWDELPPIENSLELHIRLIEAKGLPNTDVIGKSDPYCLLHINTDEKVKMRSRVVNNNCDPKWNQHFQFTIRDYVESELVLAVYDYDGKGNADDKMGDFRISIRSMKCGVTDDQWVRLNGKSGDVHIVTYLGLAGSIPFVDRPFSPYYVGVACVEALDVPKMDVVGLSDPYCLLSLTTDAKRQKTEVIDNTLHPVWGQKFRFIALTLDAVALDIQMFDQDPGADELISIGKVESLQQFLTPNGTDVWVDMTPAKGVKKGGRVHLCIKVSQNEADIFTNMVYSTSPDLAKAPKPEKEKHHKDKSKSHKSKHHGDGHGRKKRHHNKAKLGELANEVFPQGITLFVTLLKAEDIPAMDSNGLADPYVVLRLKDRAGKEKSSIIYETLTPSWEEKFRFNVLSYDDDVLQIKLMDYDKVGKDDTIGTHEIPIRQLEIGGLKNCDVLIDTVKGGKAKLKISYLLVVPKVQDTQGLAYDFYIPTSLHVRVTRGEGVKSPNASVRVATIGGLTFQETSKKPGPSPTWNEDSRFTLSGIGDGLKLTLVDMVKGKDTALGTATFTQFGEMGSVNELCAVIGESKIFFLLDYEPYGVPSRFPIVQQAGYLCQSPMLNVRIISAADIQAMDKNGKSDPYIILYAQGREAETKQKTKVVSKTLAPVWNEEFHIPIRSLQTDCVHFEMRDHDDVGKDDSISHFDLEIATLNPGYVEDVTYNFLPEKKIKKPGTVRMIVHLANAGMYAFYPLPFSPLMLHILVEEAKDIANMDVGGKSDPYCRLCLSSDVKVQKTKVISNSLTPQWFEQFSFMITSMEDIIQIVMKDEDRGKDETMATLDLPLLTFQPGYVTEKWYPLTPAKGVKRGGEIKLKIHITEKGVVPFDGYIVPPPPEPVGDVCEIQIDLERATGLPGLDVSGKSDPYCRFTLVDQPGPGITSRIIDNTCDPYWNQKLRMPVMSLRTDILRVDVMDHDKRGKDDRISTIDFPLRDMVLGVTRRGSYAMRPLGGRSKAGNIDLAIQVTQPGQVPFVDAPFRTYVLNCRVVKTEGLPDVAKSSLQCKLKLDHDAKFLVSSIKENCSNAVWNEDIQLVVTNQARDNCIIAIDNTAEKKTVAEGQFPLSSFTFRQTCEFDVKLQPSGSVHIYAQLALAEDVPYADIGLPSPANAFMTLYVKVLEGSNIPKMDKNGLADPYCALSLEGRKDVKKTEVQHKTLTPNWNQEFQLPIVSYGTDIFKLALYDHDSSGRDDKIGECRIPIRDMDSGAVVDRFLEIAGSDARPQIHVVMHLAAANQPKFTEARFKPEIVNVRVCEAMDIAKVDRIGKSDPYVSLGMLSDLSMKSTIHLDNTLTPQWFQDFSFPVTNYDSDILSFVMKDEGSTRDSKMASVELPLSQFERNYVYDDWFDMTPAGSVKVGGRLRLWIQIAPHEVEAWKCPEWPKPPLPQANCMELALKLVHAKDVPKMDSNGSDVYCTFYFRGFNDSLVNSRVIDNTTFPRWNQVIRMPIPNINSGILDFVMMDKDETTRDDVIARKSLNLRDLEPGKVITHDWTLTRAVGRGRAGTVHLLSQILAPGMTPFVDQPFTYRRVHVYVNDISGLSSQESGLYYFEVKVTGDASWKVSQVAEGQGVATFCNRFSFLIRSPEADELIFNVYKHERKGKVIIPTSVTTVNLPLAAFHDGAVHEHTQTSANGQAIRMFVQIRNDKEAPFEGITLPQKAPFVDNETRRLYIIVKNGQQLPVMDGKTKSTDAYCKLTLKGRKKLDGQQRFVGLTRVVTQSLNPTWNQTFCIPVKSIDSDVLKFAVYDYDQANKDDLIRTFTLQINTLPLGVTKEHKFGDSARGIVNVRIHLADFGQQSFVDRPFDVQKINIEVREALGIPKADRASRTDGYCTLQLVNGVRKDQTRVIHDSQTPQWFAPFSFLLNSQASDTILLSLFDDDPGRDPLLGQFTITPSQYNSGYVYDDWYPLTSTTGASAGQVRLKIHVDKRDVDPFSGTPVQKPGPEPGQVMELHVKVLEGKNIICSDVRGVGDPYVTLALRGYPETLQKSRVIDNTRSPFWDQTFRLPIGSVNTDVFVMSLWDHDVATKDDFISQRFIQLNALKPGAVVDDWINFGGYGSVHVVYHLARGGDVPFVEQLFTLLKLHVHVNDLQSPVSLSNPYMDCWMNGEKQRSPTTNQNRLIWHEDLEFVITNPLQDVLHLSLCDNLDNHEVYKGKEICQFALTTGNVPFGPPQPMILENEQGYKLSVIAQTTECGQPAFEGMNLPVKPYNAFQTMYLHVHIIEATNVPSKDSNGLSDPYVKIKYKNRGKKSQAYYPPQYTRYIEDTVHPVWNQIISMEVLNVNDDVLSLALFDHDKNSKDDKIAGCSQKITVCALIPGVVGERTLDFGQSQMRVKFHLAAPNQPAFVDNQFQLYEFNVRIIEAKNVCAQAKPEPRCKLLLTGSSKWRATSKKKDTESPQWFDNYSFVLTSIENDTVTVAMCCDDTVVDDLILRPRDYEFRKSVCDWFPFSRDPNMMVKLLVQVTYQGEPKFADYVEPHDHIVCSDVMLHVNVNKAKDLPKMDASGKNDVYVTILNRAGQTFQTRVIENSSKPVWNQDFHVPVTSIHDEEITFRVYDKDPSRSELIGLFKVRLCDVPCGTILQREFHVDSGEGAKGGGYVECMLHLTAEGQPSFVEAPWVPYEVHAQVKTIGDIREKIADAHPFFTARMSCDGTEVQGPGMCGNLCETFRRTVTSLRDNSFIAILYNYDREYSARPIGQAVVPLCDIQPGVVSTSRYNLTLQGKEVGVEVEVNLLIKPKSDEPLYFSPVRENLYPIVKTNAPYRIYAKFEKAHGTNYHYIVTCSDPYPLTRTSQIRYVMVGGDTEQILYYDIEDSLNSQVMHMDVQIWRPGERMPWQKEFITDIDVYQMPLGTIDRRRVKLRSGGELEFSFQVTTPDRAPLVHDPFPGLVCYAHVIEGVDMPIMDTLSSIDCSVREGLMTDKHQVWKEENCSGVIKDSATPQWNRTLKVFLTKPVDTVVLTLYDYDSDGRVQPVSEGMFSTEDLQDGKPKSMWLDCNNFKRRSSRAALNVVAQVCLEDKKADFAPFILETVPAKYLK